MITTKEKTELPPGWRWHYRETKASSYIAEKSGQGIRSPGFPDEAGAAHWAHLKEESLKEDSVVAETPSLEKALHRALHSVQNATERWRPLTLNGATDSELMSAIGYEFGLGGGSTDHGGYRYKGGKRPEFSWPGYADQSKAQTFKGKRLLAKVREVLGIGAPGQAGEAADEEIGFHPGFPPGFDPKRAERGLAQVEGPDHERLHKQALARWRREPGAGGSSSNGYHPRMLQMIPINNIEPSPTNPRKHFDQAKLQELADSISEHGLIEPILVRPVKKSHLLDDCYQIVAGERRWRAAKLAGLKEIEAKVRDLDDKAVLEIQFIENLQRSDLSAIEEAEGYKRLLDEHGYTAESLAGKLSKSKSYVYGRLKLCNLPAVAMDALVQGLLPATIGELIGRLPNMQMREEFWEENFGGVLGKDWFDMPSFRDVKVEIEREYMRELKSAPFPQNDKRLVPEAGSCKDCPKRTGNNRAEYPDSRADICTDVPCYNRKVEAFNERKLAEATKSEGVRVLSPEESEKWFGVSRMISTAETRDYIDLNEECDQVADPDDWEAETPTYAELLGDSVKTEVVGLDRGGQVHQLVSREAAEKILKERGIKITSLAQTEADRKASQQKHKEERQIRGQAGNEICDRVIQSLTDNPLYLDSRLGTRAPAAFLEAIGLHLFSDADVARFVARRRELTFEGDAPAAMRRAIPNLSESGMLELIIEYLIAEELEWWIRSGELPWPLKRFPICEYFGHDPRKIEKRIAKVHAAAKKAKAKPKAKGASGN